MTSSLPQGCSTTIERLCRQAGVSRAGYYRFWRASAPRAHDTTVRDAIQRLALANGRHRGYRLVTFQLRQEGMIVNHKRVLRLMRADNLLCLRQRPFVPPTTDSRHGWPVVPNLARGMQPNDLDQLWVADITYIPTWSGFIYLAVVLDVWSRKIVGWSIEPHLRTELVLAALNSALAQRRPQRVIHHSDHGCQYTSYAFGKRCREMNVMLSMGSVGDAYDNAMAESLFATLEREVLDRRRFKTQAEAKLAVFEWIEGWYNPRRRHSSLGRISPINYERRHLNHKAA